MKQFSKTILLVEDNEDDVFAMERALKQAQIANPLVVAGDGQEALDYLSGAREYKDRERYPLPFIIFLDLKLPYVDGFEILTWIRERQDLDPTVVVVLTSSAENRDQEKAYALGARSYLIKPPTAEGLLDVLNSLRSYWLARAASPPWSQSPAAAA